MNQKLEISTQVEVLSVLHRIFSVLRRLVLCGSFPINILYIYDICVG